MMGTSFPSGHTQSRGKGTLTLGLEFPEGAGGVIFPSYYGRTPKSYLQIANSPPHGFKVQSSGAQGWGPL